MNDRPKSPPSPASDWIVDSRLDDPSTRRPAEPGLPVAGDLCGDYRLLEPIGAGGFSLVWRAQHRLTGALVAIKLPRVPEFIDHLIREAAIHVRFSDPQVVGILEVRLDHEPPYLVSPFVPGADLDLPERAPAPVAIEKALRRFRRIAEVVARLHEAEVVHGDLKPGNIRFDPEGTCHLLDLGLARIQVQVRQTTSLRASIASVTGENIAGTLEYMAPEVAAGGRPEKAADVYALGVLLHTMLCGRPPAFGVSPEERNPYLPPGATDFLRQMLDFDPERRLLTAGALLPIVDALIRTEDRCLCRLHGHERRLVFRERMRTLARGIKVLGSAATFGAFLWIGVPSLEKLIPPQLGGLAALVLGLGLPLLVLLACLLGMTTLNAWVLGIPEKTYKNRRGHPWWTFMMQ